MYIFIAGFVFNVYSESAEFVYIIDCKKKKRKKGLHHLSLEVAK